LDLFVDGIQLRLEVFEFGDGGTAGFSANKLRRQLLLQGPQRLERLCIIHADLDFEGVFGHIQAEMIWAIIIGLLLLGGFATDNKYVITESGTFLEYRDWLGRKRLKKL
jgi:hypothetical protein